MKIVKVSFGKTFNTGNFTSERYDVEAELDSLTEDPIEVVALLKAQVEKMRLGRPLSDGR